MDFWKKLARFGHIIEMEVEKKHNPFIFLATYLNLLEKYDKLEFFSLKSS